MEGKWEHHRSHILNDSRNGYSRIFFFLCFLSPELKKK